MEKDLQELYDMKEKAETTEQIDTCQEMIDIYQKKMDKNPEGYWLAYQGKTNYKQFCYCAHETLQNMRKQKMQWRVVEGAIEDKAQTWAGYETIKENTGVMKYLWATL